MAVQPADPYETPEEKQARLLREAQANKAGAGGAVGGGLSGALGGAGTGATIGSVIPGLGTAIGAGLGAIAGGISGAVKGGADAKKTAVGAPQSNVLPSQAATAALSPMASKPGSIMDQTAAMTGPGQAMVGRVRPGQEQMVSPPQPPAMAGQQAPAPSAMAPARPQPVNGLLAALGKIPGAIGHGIEQNPTSAIGLASDIGNTIGDFAQNGSERRNAEQIDALKRKEATGEGLGGREKALLSAGLMNPVRESTTELANSLSGANGQVSPAQLASMRRDAGATIADASQRAAGQVEGADLDAAKANRAELEQRIATRSAGGEQNRANLGGRLGQALTEEGERAGAPPLDIMGPYGEPIKDTGQAQKVMTDLGIPPADIQWLLTQPPEVMQELFRGLQPQSPAMGG